jgi:hypothetical protein
VFAVVSVSEAMSGESKHKPVSPSREWRYLERVCRQINQSESEAIVRQSSLVEAWEAKEFHCLKALRMNAKLV